jgi:Ser/Thr protein kinase RdoA (MazF antagonist)
MTGLTPIVTATIDYEEWLRSQVDVVETDLHLKHRQMASSLFAFLRATFYRWGPLWSETCPDLVETPRVLAVGDLHVENFGTWRDKEGRLVWGVNDFDEVARMPYAADLVRLVTSAIVAQSENRLAIDAAGAATAVLGGYTEFLEADGKPFILEESHPHLREMALTAERDPVHFWSKLSALHSIAPPRRIQRLLRKSLSEPVDNIAFSDRIAGEGSLGRPRYVATGSSNGGFVAREAKAWLPSAWGWAKGRPKEHAYSVRLLKHSVRQPDPYYSVQDGWIVRRLGPHCGRIELTEFPKRRDERLILKDMGRETANLHLATPDQRINVLHDLNKRKPDWLVNAAQSMARATKRDWESFKSSQLAMLGAHHPHAA